MARQITLDRDGRLDLVGTFEAHLLLGVERSRIARFLKDNAAGRQRIAPPVAELQCGPIWLRSQVEDAARAMFEDAGAPGDFDEWVVERAVKRALSLPNVPSQEALEGILRRSLGSDHAAQLRGAELAAA